MAPPILTCTEVTPQCPVEFTIYGYYPNLGANAFFLAAFLLLLLLQLSIGIWKRTWTFTLGVALGCLGESIGYIGRLIENANPWSIPGTGMNIFCLVVSPSFVAAAIYLTLKHVVLYAGPEHSRVPPAWYPWIFILCDVASILIQAIGGAMGAAAQGGNTSLLSVGNALIITGIVLQVVTMSIFGLLALEFFVRRRRMGGTRRGVQVDKLGDAESPERSPEPRYVGYNQAHFKLFIAGVVFAYVTILIRCIYRIVEMAGGWGGPIMKDEPSFLVLDGMMVLLAVIALTAAHPGFLFTPMSKANGW